MPETAKTCAQCGKELTADTKFCPNCGAPQVAAPLAEAEPVAAQPVAPMAAPEAEPGPSVVSTYLALLQSSFQTYRWWWAGGGGAVVVAAIALVLIYGGFFGPSGKLICTAAVDQARDYGVIPYSAKLASSDAKSTNVKNRRQCQANAGGDVYDIQADVKLDDKKCRKDLKGEGCVKLYSVARTDGLTTYQVRQIPPDETDAALTGNQGAGDAAASPTNAAAAAPAAAATPGNGVENDLAVDNSASAPATGNAAQPAQLAPDADSGDNPQ